MVVAMTLVSKRAGLLAIGVVAAALLLASMLRPNDSRATSAVPEWVKQSLALTPDGVDRPAITQTSLAQRAAFSVLRRAAPTDEGASATVASLVDPGSVMTRRFGLNMTLARSLPLRGSGADAWVVPGDDALCLFVPDGKIGYGGTCGTTEEALAGRLLLTIEQHSVRGPGDSVRLIGLLPDGVTANVEAESTTSSAPDATGVLDTTATDLRGVNLALPTGEVHYSV
jgi:hypothetical protein